MVFLFPLKIVCRTCICVRFGVLCDRSSVYGRSCNSCYCCLLGKYIQYYFFARRYPYADSDMYVFTVHATKSGTHQCRPIDIVSVFSSAPFVVRLHLYASIELNACVQCNTVSASIRWIFFLIFLPFIRLLVNSFDFAYGFDLIWASSCLSVELTLCARCELRKRTEQNVPQDDYFIYRKLVDALFDWFEFVYILCAIQNVSRQSVHLKMNAYILIASYRFRTKCHRRTRRQRYRRNNKKTMMPLCRTRLCQMTELMAMCHSEFND